MKKYFGNYYQLSDTDFDKLWGKCVFILDTNIFTNLYRYSEDVRADFIKLLKKISDRLWIPYQVALEYQENRLSVIAEQVNKFSDVETILIKAKDELRKSLEKLHLTNRHSSINPENFNKTFDGLFKALLKDLKKKENEQPGVGDNDKIRDEIDSLINGKIGLPPDSQQKLEDIYKEGKIRYELYQPPGYMDKEKGNGEKKKAYFNKGLVFRREYGDLILWHQIIEEIREKEHQYVIFVTDDNKEDWWLIVESKGKKTIGPRPELIDEISTKAGVKLFYMYNSERFLQHGKNFLKVPVKEKSINEVRDFEESKNQMITSQSLSNILRDTKSLYSQSVRAALDDVMKNKNLYGQSVQASLSDILRDTKSLYSQSVRAALDDVMKNKNLYSQSVQATLADILRSKSLYEHLTNDVRDEETNESDDIQDK
ncbi:MAG: PIN-like domain-containing protein [Thermodesulfovibrionales bacterium]